MVAWSRLAAVALAVVLAACGGPAAPRDAATPIAAPVAPVVAPPAVASAAASPYAYPAAPRGDVVDDYHGVKVADPYRWLESTDTPATRAWIDAENRLTRGYLTSIPERDHIAERLRELFDYERFRVPEQHGARIVYAASKGLQNQPVLYVMDGPGGRPRVLLDPNPLSADGTVAVSFQSMSRDGRLLAYGLSSAGSDWTEIHVRDVATAKDLPDRIQWTKFSDAAWRKDGSGFFYTRFPEPPKDQPSAPTYFQKVFYHRVGSDPATDPLVFEKLDQKEWTFGITITDDDRHVVLTVDKGTDEKNEVFFAKLGSKPPALAAFTSLNRNFDAEYAFVGSTGTAFYFRTNQGAPRGRVVKLDVTHPDEKSWVEVVPESVDTLQEASWVADRLVLTYLKDAHSVVRVHDLAGKPLHELTLPGIGSVRGFWGRQHDAATFFSFASYTTPGVIYRYEPASNTATPFLTPKLPFDPTKYETEQVFATSNDGTRVPIFLVHAKGLVRDGATPTYLYGYGGFNIPLLPGFSPDLVEWIEMGGVYAVAILRGGGEYGKAWHEAGMKQKKQNVFDDFTSAARYLVSSGLTRVDRLAIGGRSNGGLLVGACLTQHPELFGAALPGVGVMDMLRYHRYTIGWAWADEYGTSDDPEELRTLLAYSPLQNVKPGTRYPATLVTTGDHDDRVVPGHSFKFAAALQAAQVGPAPVMIRIETSAGHGGGTPTGKLVEEDADRWAFLVRELHFTPWAAAR
ncbi:MAG TPA: prolyl oligopeptidase family serine peptidase [Polyangiaceae bacterium]|jgi:prolyl oligopeptidase|nr:prolyl oligopeptidase family serine peptidase [Polyangiaceae bacterium]